MFFLRIYYCFSLEKQKFKSYKWGQNKNSKVVNGDVDGTSSGPSCRTSRGPNDGTFWGRPRDVGHKCFLNSTEKHIKLTLTGYSSELR